jgi:hypothetical protein
MNLYPHDCSYLNTEYGRRKSQECYDIEALEKEKALDDGEQEDNEYKNVAGCPRSSVWQSAEEADAHEPG